VAPAEFIVRVCHLVQPSFFHLSQQFRTQLPRIQGHLRTHFSSASKNAPSPVSSLKPPQALVKRVLPSMAPTPEPFLPADLATRVQITAEGKRRKTAVDLEKCSLRELVQYNCNIEKRGDVVCVPVSRWFRCKATLHTKRGLKIVGSDNVPILQVREWLDSGDVSVGKGGKRFIMMILCKRRFVTRTRLSL